jgi:hypothetical protein
MVDSNIRVILSHHQKQVVFFKDLTSSHTLKENP